MKKCINLKPHESAALARGETITIWRVLNPQPHPAFLARGVSAITSQLPLQNGVRWFMHDGMSELQGIPLPLNVPLLGKETWGDMALSGYPAVLAYKADPTEEEGWGLPPGFQWRSSTQMPPWAVRTLVTLSDVRVRKPCDVTEGEAYKMGFETTPCLLCDESGVDPTGLICADCAGDGWHHSYSNFHSHFEKSYQTSKDSWTLYHWSYTATPTKKEAK